MSSQNLTILPFLVLLLALLLSAHAQITVAPPPPITERKVYALKDSANDAALITSNKMENLELTTTTTAGNTTTFFELRHLNRRAPTNVSSYNFTVPGRWTYIMRSRQSLSCIAVADIARNMVGLVLFNRQTQTFRMLASANVTMFSTSPLDADFITYIKQNIYVGERCMVGSFSNATDTTVYRLNKEMTQIVIVRSIANSQLQARTDDLIYGIYANGLYRYNHNTYQYDLIRSFNPYQRYTMANRDRRIMVSASNFTPNALNTNGHTFDQANYTIWIFNDLPTELKSVGMFKV